MPEKSKSRSDMNPKVDFYFNKAKKWQQELEQLRTIVLDCELEEELKWGCPCYTLNSNNVVLIHSFKDYCALLFHKGVLLKNDHGLLIQQTKNVQVARQIRFTSSDQIRKQEQLVKAIIHESIEVEQKGLKVELMKTAEFEMAEEFKSKLDEMPSLKKAFYALTPGRQRGYLLHFSSAKQAKTREDRVAKAMELILSGKGLDDK